MTPQIQSILKSIELKKVITKMRLEKKLHEDVYYYTGVIDNPNKLIQDIEFLDNKPESYEAISKWMQDFSQRERKDLLPDRIPSIEPESRGLVEEVITTMQDAIRNVATAFVKDRGLNLTPNISPMLDICKYSVGGGIGPHFDGQDGDRSILYTIVLYFNDDQQGGDVSFSIVDEEKYPWPDVDYMNLTLDFSVKPAAGSALVFPSQYPYLHLSTPLISGNKYISTAFIFIEGFDIHNEEQVKEYRKNV